MGSIWLTAICISVCVVEGTVTVELCEKDEQGCGGWDCLNTSI